MLKVHYSDEDKIRSLVANLRQYLVLLFITTDIKEIKITKNNLRHYKDINSCKIGDSIRIVEKNTYKSQSDFVGIYNLRLNERLKIPETKEIDFLTDELDNMNYVLDMMTKYDDQNRHLGILRRYIDFLKEKWAKFHNSTPPDDYFRDRIKYPHKDALITYIQDNYKNSKPQQVAILAFALEDKHTRQTINDNVTLCHSALSAVLGNIGTREAMQSNFSLMNTSDAFRKKVTTLAAKLLEDLPME